MSWCPDYVASGLKNIPRHKVPIVYATRENFKEYGSIYDKTIDPEIIITPWNVSGRRKLIKGTGVGEGMMSGVVEYRYDGKYLRVKNNAVGREYFTGVYYENDRKIDDASNVKIPRCVLVREANYHPDSGQLFVSSHDVPFILLLALPTDDVKLGDFIGFEFDGTQNVQINPYIWHHPVFPLEPIATFFTKQGAVNACVGMDTIDEFGKWLEISLE